MYIICIYICTWSTQSGKGALSTIFYHLFDGLWYDLAWALTHRISQHERWAC